MIALLGGCGWQPLYGDGAAGLGAASQLNDIAIPQPKTRLEQVVRNELVRLMTPQGAPRNARYRLEIVPTVSTDDVFVQKNTNVRRIQYQLNVNYRLFDTGGRKPVITGHSFSLVSYTRVVSEYANIRSEENARKKAARAVSEDIRTRLASYFAGSG